jgi:D-tyrosyl-tRNA(Tyr) deacylase
MRALIQRVSQAQVTVNQQVVGKIDQGLLVLMGFGDKECDEDMDWMLKKIVQLRIFNDTDGVMNLNVNQMGGRLLVVSQFTLMASTKKGNRPSYVAAANPTQAEMLYMKFVQKCKSIIHTETGIFGADMKVSLTNDGPVTIWLDSKNKT